MFNRSSVGVFLAAMVIFTAGVQATPAQSAVKVNIASQPLAESLRALAAVLNVSVVANPADVKGIRAPAVNGILTAQQAFTQLLAGTQLQAVFANDSTISVLPVAAARTVIEQMSTQARSETGDGVALRVAQVGARSEKSQAAENKQTEASSSYSSEDKKSSVQEIIVTAQKREEKLIDVPISIVALSSDELRQRKITNMDDLQMVVPGLAMQSTGTWQRRIVLRGISNMFGSGSSLIGIYLDDAAITSRSDMQPYVGTYDLERVEVLRGPQGTLYGEGSVGGTLRFITKNPELDQFGLTASVDALYTQDGGAGERLESAVNIPLVQDVLGMRISGTFDRQSGWIDQPAADMQDINDQDLMNVRIKTLWKPTDKFTVNLMAVFHRNDAGPNIGEDDDGNFRQNFFQATQPNVDDRYKLFNAALSYDFRGATLLSNTAYMDQSKDARFLGFTFPFSGPPPAPLSEFYTSQYFKAEIFTQELRLTSSGSGPWKWTIGGFYRDYETPYGSPNGSRFGTRGDPLPAPFTFGGQENSESWAIFGDTSYDITERLTLGVGVRTFEDKQEAWSTIDRTDVPVRGTVSTTNPRIYGQFKLAEGVNTYASAAKGFRSGGFNSLPYGPYDAEEVWTYELGLKTSLLGGRLQTDAALFHSDYENFQILGILPTSFDSLISNAGNARIRGIEWSVSWYPSQLWNLTFNGNYLDHEFVKISAVDSTHLVGDPLDLTPNVSFNLSAQRNFEVTGRGAFARLDYNHAGRSTYRNRTQGPWYRSESDVIEMLNFNAALQWSESLTLNLFAQNVLNDRGNVNPWEVQGSASRSRPRTYGIGFDVSFK